MVHPSVIKPTLENDQTGFTIKQVKAKASDCKKTHRWARVRCEVKGELFTYRVIGIGTKYVRLMDGSGFIWKVMFVLDSVSMVLSVNHLHRSKQ